MIQVKVQPSDQSVPASRILLSWARGDIPISYFLRPQFERYFHKPTKTTQLLDCTNYPTMNLTL